MSKKPEQMPLTAGSLFSGAVDGLGIAASLAGFDILFHVEYDDWRRKVLKKHDRLWPHSQMHKDVSQVSGACLPVVDVLFGGFPCQDVSLAGRRGGLGEGTRSGLWSEFRRLVGDLRPRAVVVENTTGLLSLGGATVVKDLAEMGYMGRVGVISAADAGAPHLRERVFILAYTIQNRQPGAEPRPGADNDSQNGRNSLRESTHNRQREHDRHPVEPGGAVRREALAVADEARRQGLPDFSEVERTIHRRRYADRRAAKNGTGRAAESGLGRNSDGLTPGLDGFRGYPGYQNQPQYPDEPPRTIPAGSVKDRVRRVEALGDAVVWQVAYPVFYYLYQRLST